MVRPLYHSRHKKRKHTPKLLNIQINLSSIFTIQQNLLYVKLNFKSYRKYKLILQSFIARFSKIV
jgi:hypothetical protein